MGRRAGYKVPAPPRNDLGQRRCSGWGPGGLPGHFIEIENFSLNSRFADGLHNMCRDCQRESSKRSNPRQQAKRYGLAPGWEAHFSEQYKRQDGKCAICGEKISDRYGTTSERGKHAYRDHKHGKQVQNRGMLCMRCNLALERLENHDGWERKARAYLDCWDREDFYIWHWSGLVA